MSGLTMISPTRGRPGAAAELARVFAGTVTGDTRLLLVVDADDPAREGYEALTLPGCAALRVQGEHRRFGPVLSAAAVAEAPGRDFVGVMGDDSLPRTGGWDEVLCAALTAPGVAYGDDLLQHENLPTACVITSRVVTTLGYLCPPGIEHLYLDNFWYRLGDDLGNRRYLPEVVIEHVHPAAGKVAWDDGYRAANSGAQYSRDGGAFEQFLAGRWPVDLARLKEALA